MKMGMILERQRETPVLMKVDVVVAGGGVAGIAAAVAAARSGANVLLVERNGFLGGTATSGLCPTFMGVDPLTTKGLSRELIGKLKRLGPIIEGFYTYFDPETFKYVALEMVDEAGVELLLHSLVVNAIVENSKINGIVVENKSGRQVVLADVVVDATGDGDVAARAGAPYEKGREQDGLTQAMTLIFRMGNVDIEKFLKYVEENRAEFFPMREKHDIGQIGLNRKPPLVSVGGFFNLIKEATKKGELYLNHECMWVESLPRSGEVLVNATHVTNVDGTSAWDLTKAEVEARKQAISVVNLLKKYVPGFESSLLIDTAFQIGVRESRRILGEYVLRMEDVLEGRNFQDVVARNFMPIDIHGPGKGQTWIKLKRPYDIPYRCLVPRNIDNLLVAGRCISATHEAQGSIRSMPCCMATGQAAGIAASLAVRNSVSPRRLSVSTLQHTLTELGWI